MAAQITFRPTHTRAPRARPLCADASGAQNTAAHVCCGFNEFTRSCTAQRHRCDRAINITHCSNHDSVRQHLLQHFAAAAEVLLAERLARLRARVRRKVRMRRGLGD